MYRDFLPISGISILQIMSRYEFVGPVFAYGLNCHRPMPRPDKTALFYRPDNFIAVSRIRRAARWKGYHFLKSGLLKKTTAFM